eukprot:gene4838-3469_t
MDATAMSGFLDLLPPQAWLDLFGVLVEAKPVGGADDESATKEQTAPSSTHLHDIDTLILVNRPVLRRLNGEHAAMVYALVLPRIVEKTRLILQMAVFLWAFTLYDVVGRASGAVEAIWVLVLVVLLPSWVAALQWVVQQTGSRMSLRCCTASAASAVATEEAVSGGVEMQTQSPLQPPVADVSEP